VRLFTMSVCAGVLSECMSPPVTMLPECVCPLSTMSMCAGVLSECMCCLYVQGESYPTQLLSTCPPSGTGSAGCDALRINREAARCALPS
jgi:hypothetical protein